MILPPEGRSFMLIEVEVSEETWKKIEAVAFGNSRTVQEQIALSFQFPAVKVDFRRKHDSRKHKDSDSSQRADG